MNTSPHRPRAPRAAASLSRRSIAARAACAGLAVAMAACSAGGADPDAASSDDALVLRDGKAVAQAQMTRDQQVAEQLLAARPGGQKRIDRLRRAPAPATSTKVIGDGNYVITVPGERGTQVEMVTQSRRFAYADLARSLTRVGTRDNQLSVYQMLYESLPLTYRAEAQLAAPETLSGETAAQLLARNQQIAAGAARIAELTPPPALTVPIGDEGAGDDAGLDEGDGAASCTRSTNGLVAIEPAARRLTTTRIKSQGHRGTCVSFALTAALETGYGQKHGTFPNLSEQGLYGVAKAVWNGDDYGDGLSTTGTIDDMSGSYRFLRETEWTYNPSHHRVANDDTERYTESCVGYNGRHCSNTAHQGTRDGDHWDVGAPTNSGIMATGSADIDTDDDGVATAKIVITTLRRPVVLSIEVTPSFKQPWNGYLLYRGDDEDSVGNHAVLIVGYADNKDIPSTSPPGAGGGYFIVKNSWGCGFGDGGFIYVPYRWITDYANSMSVVHVN